MQLDFNVEEQTLTWVNREKTPVADSVKYLTAKFTFSDEWTGLNKTAIFFAQDGKPYSQILVDDGCEVPHEVIKSPLFKVSVAGGDLITTNIIIIGIIKSGYVKGETPKPPTPDVYTQILEKCDEAIETAKDVEERANNGEFVGEKGEDYVLTDVDKEEISTMASNKAKAYTDEQAGTLVKKGENWTDKYVPEITKIILPSVSYYHPDDESENSFYIRDDNWNSWMAFTNPGETLIFDILANKENKLVTVIDEATGKEKAKIQDTWGIYDNIENCVELGSDLGCIFYCYNDAKVYADEVGIKATQSAVEESNQYTDKKIGSMLTGSAFGEVVAIDDISPVSKDITVKMESKNLLPFPYYWNSRTVSGITFTVNDDGSVTANGTATATVNFMFVDRNTFTLPAGTYSFSLTPQVANSYYLVTGGSTGSPITSGNGNRTVTFGGGLIGYFALQIKQGVVLDNVTFYPQIEKGLTATGYTPYFTEWDIAGVDVYGKNLFGGTFEIGGIAGGSGANYNNSAQIRSDYIPIKQGNYYLSTLGSEYTMSGIFFYDENAVMTKAITTVIANRAFTTDTVGASYMRYRIARADGANITEEDLVKVKSAFQFEVGTSASNYEPYVEPVCYEAWRLAESGGKIEGMYPNTTLMSEVDGVVMGVEYSRDLNKAFADLEQAIISLGGNI